MYSTERRPHAIYTIRGCGPLFVGGDLKPLDDEGAAEGVVLPAKENEVGKGKREEKGKGNEKRKGRGRESTW